MDPSPPSSASAEPELNLARHIKYHLRCLKTLLPTAYTSNDSNRLLLAFLTLNALDLLSALDAHLSPAERADHIAWLYRCQLSSGGFRGFTGIDPGARGTASGEAWDPANLAGTFFALVALVLLGDDLHGVRRREARRWLRRLQWEDGSVGEVLEPGGRPSGGQDLRFCYMAAAIWYILWQEGDEGEDLDVVRLGDFVVRSQAYDGGFGRMPMHEGNAGWTYCAVACLQVLGRLSSQGGHAEGEFSLDRLLHWLAARQIPCPEEPNSEDEAEESEHAAAIESSLQDGEADLSPLRIDAQDLYCAGLNGRCNKPADTCYSFWAVGALEILGHTSFIDRKSNRRYLLERTQHLIGGFGKTEGDPPDVLHSSLGLAALSFMQEPGIKRLDPVFCLSVDARKRLEEIRRNWKE